MDGPSVLPTVGLLNVGIAFGSGPPTPAVAELHG
jgi:hypothetical protein